MNRNCRDTFQSNILGDQDVNVLQTTIKKTMS